jgi:hypothetical protein
MPVCASRSPAQQPCMHMPVFCCNTYSALPAYCVSLHIVLLLNQHAALTAYFICNNKVYQETSLSLLLYQEMRKPQHAPTPFKSMLQLPLSECQCH